MSGSTGAVPLRFGYSATYDHDPLNGPEDFIPYYGHSLNMTRSFEEIRTASDQIHAINAAAQQAEIASQRLRTAGVRMFANYQAPTPNAPFTRFVSSLCCLPPAPPVSPTRYRVT